MVVARIGGSKWNRALPGLPAASGTGHCSAYPSRQYRLIIRREFCGFEDLGRFSLWRPMVVARIGGSNRVQAQPAGSNRVQAQPAGSKWNRALPGRLEGAVLLAVQQLPADPFAADEGIAVTAQLLVEQAAHARHALRLILPADQVDLFARVIR